MKNKFVLTLLVTSLLLVSCQDAQEPVANNTVIENTQEDITSEPEEETVIEVEEEVVESKKIILPMSKLIDGVEKWGYVNASDLNEVVIEYQYTQASFFDEKSESAIVTVDETVGVIDKTGVYLIPLGKFKTIHTVSKNILYGTTNEDQPIIFDIQCNYIYEAEPGEYIYNHNGILEIQKNVQSKYLDPVTELIMELPEMDYIQRDLFFMTVDKAVDVKINLETQQYNIYRSNKLLSDDSFDYVEPVEEFIIVGTNVEESESYDPAPRLGVLDERGNVLIDILYYDINYLGDDYFTVAEYYNYSMNYKQYSKEVYKKAIFKRTEAVTGFDYYIIEPVKDDIFYVFDGDSYYFLDVSTHQKVSGITLDGPFEFRTVGDTIIASHDNYDGKIIVYINDWKIEKKVFASYNLSDGIVISKYKSSGINPIFYPLVALGSVEVEEKINDDLKIQFDTIVPEADEQEGVYFEVLSIGFDVKEYKNILQITQHYYWYGLGAAHGNYGETTFLYDLETGDRLRMADLFKPDVDFHQVLSDVLTVIALEDERLYVNLSELTNEERVEYFKRDIYNFNILEESLYVYYNPYDIGPYAAGIIDFEIPYSELEAYLDMNRTW